MAQADPWDETARLQKQMEVELLAKLDRSGVEPKLDATPTESTPLRPSDTRTPEDHR